jgi:Alw26I/Eco31I/Esp3I family type II restriction m6 adenine DNA methyltransferase
MLPPEERVRLPRRDRLTSARLKKQYPRAGVLGNPPHDPLDRLRKEYGIYLTPKAMAESISTFVLSQHIAPIVDGFERAVQHNDKGEASRLLEDLLNTRICDPFVGNGVFIVSAARELLHAREKIVEEMERSATHIEEFLGDRFPQFQSGKESRLQFASYIVWNCLYGVDLNPDAVARTVESLTSLLSVEVPLGVNLKVGNSLVSPISPNELVGFASMFRLQIAELIRFRNATRRAAPVLPSVEAKEASEKTFAGPITKNELVKRAGSLVGNFFWEIEFPEVFFDIYGNPRADGGGFDVILSNPPWEVLKPNDREFFSEFIPSFRQEKKDKRERLKRSLLADQNAAKEYNRYVEKIEALSAYVRLSGHYNYQRETGGMAAGLNLYKISFEKLFNLCRPNGFVGVLTPLGITGDYGSKQLRTLLFESCRLIGFWGFDPAARIFEGTDQPLCLCIYQKGGLTESFEYISGLRSVQALRSSLSDQQRETIRIDPGFVARTSPLSWSIPSLRDQADLDIVSKLYSHPLLAERVANEWNVEFSRDLDETNDRAMFRTFDTGIPLLKGKYINRYRIVRQPSIWVDAKEYALKARDTEKPRIVWRDVARPNLKKRMIAALAPPRYAIGNSLNYVRPIPNMNLCYFLLAVLNSMVIEYRIRQITTNSHIKIFIVKQLPVPRLRPDSPVVLSVANRVEKLVAGRDEQADIMNEVDAMVARIYSLTLDEYSHVINGFEKLGSSEKTGLLSSYEKLTHAD